MPQRRKPDRFHVDLHVPDLLDELLDGNRVGGPLRIAVQVAREFLGRIAERAAELDDPELNALMIETALHDVPIEDRARLAAAQRARMEPTRADEDALWKLYALGRMENLEGKDDPDYHAWALKQGHDPEAHYTQNFYNEACWSDADARLASDLGKAVALVHEGMPDASITLKAGGNLLSVNGQDFPFRTGQELLVAAGREARRIIAANDPALAGNAQESLREDERPTP